MDARLTASPFRVVRPAPLRAGLFYFGIATVHNPTSDVCQSWGMLAAIGDAHKVVVVLVRSPADHSPIHDCVCRGDDFVDAQIICDGISSRSRSVGILDIGVERPFPNIARHVVLDFGHFSGIK